MNITVTETVPEILYSKEELSKFANDYLLVLGCSKTSEGEPITLHSLRQHFGIDPDLSEPCFYNQDWYMKEDFMYKSLSDGWYLIRKTLFEESRAKNYDEMKNLYHLPSAVLCAFVFFANFFHNGEYLWKDDFVWCSDTDHSDDRIYVGRYNDINGLNKNGFSIHRHLKLKKWYGFIDAK